MPDALSHLDSEGRAQMVDVSGKEDTVRFARARATVRMSAQSKIALMSGQTPKGDVWATARIAGITAAKKTSELIPLCHAIALASARVEFVTEGDPERVEIRTFVQAKDRTGVEMEALTSASVAALTLYDMLKAIDRSIVIERVELLEKRGGTRGDYVREL